MMVGIMCVNQSARSQKKKNEGEKNIKYVMMTGGRRRRRRINMKNYIHAEALPNKSVSMEMPQVLRIVVADAVDFLFYFLLLPGHL